MTPVITRIITVGIALAMPASALGASDPAPQAASQPKPTGEAAPKAQGQSASDLAKKLQNPIASIVSIPLQNNTDFGVGTESQVSNTLNIQPVVPIPAGPFNIITRTILPVVSRPSSATQSGEDRFGLGDLTTTWFLSLKKSRGLIWGVGPVWYFPTATSDDLGSGQFGVGPSVIALATPGKWVFGALFSWIWSFAGPDDRPDVNMTTVQYFINYNLPQGWYISVAPILTGNWEIVDGPKWTVPFGGGVGKLVRFGKLPVNFQVHGYGNVIKPTNGADATLRVQVQFVLPSFF